MTVDQPPPAQDPAISPDSPIARWAATAASVAPRGVSAHAHAVAELRRAIADGVLPPGTVIPEQVVAEVLGTSRNTLREAFRALRNDGLLEHRAHRGVVVPLLRPDDIVDIYNARILLQCGALREAHRSSPGSIAAVQSAADAGMAALPGGRSEDFRRHGWAFHLAIVGLAGSQLLLAFADTLWTRLQIAYHQTHDLAEFHSPYTERNAEIAALLTAGEHEQAAGAMRDYLRDAQSQLIVAIATPAR